MKQEQLQSMRKESFHTKKGFSVVEALLSAAIFAIVVLAVVSAYLYGEESTALSGNRARAVYFAEEGLEAVHNIRDSGFANLTDGTYGLSTSGNQWSLFGSSDIQDIFTRSVTISTIDTNRKLVTSNVSWQQNGQRTGQVSLATRLTYWMKVGLGNWASPALDGSADLSGTTASTKVQVSGNYAYTLRGTGSNNFVVIDVSNTASPMVVATLTLPGIPLNLFVSGNYAYIASTDDNSELQIIDIATPNSPVLYSTFNATGTSNANGIYVSGSKAYIVRGSSVDNEFVVVDVATPLTPLQLGSLDLASAGYEVVVSGNYAYVGTDATSQEIKAINVTNPTPLIAGGLNLAGSVVVRTVALSGTTLVAGTSGSLFVTMSVSNPSSPTLLGSISTVNVLNDIALVFGNAGAYAYLATDESAFEFKVADITTPSVPIILGKYNVVGNSQLTGAAYDSSKDRAFVVGNAGTQEFLVIKPQ